MRWRVKRRVERGERDLARLVEREHLFVGGDGVLGAAELLLVDLGHLRVERLALRRLVGELDAPAVDADEIAPPLGAPVEAVERLERLGVGRVRARGRARSPWRPRRPCRAARRCARAASSSRARARASARPSAISSKIASSLSHALASPASARARRATRRSTDRPSSALRLRLEREVHVAERVDRDARHLALQLRRAGRRPPRLRPGSRARATSFCQSPRTS